MAPYLSVDGASRAAEFYARAFGAEEVARHPVDEKGRTMQIHLYVNGGSLMLSDAYPEHGHPLEAPQSCRPDQNENLTGAAAGGGADGRCPGTEGSVTLMS